jgi:hypothetical protein
MQTVPGVMDYLDKKKKESGWTPGLLKSSGGVKTH